MVFYKKGALKSFAEFTGKYLSRSLFIMSIFFLNNLRATASDDILMSPWTLFYEQVLGN